MIAIAQTVRIEDRRAADGTPVEVASWVDSFGWARASVPGRGCGNYGGEAAREMTIHDAIFAWELAGKPAISIGWSIPPGWVVEDLRAARAGK